MKKVVLLAPYFLPRRRVGSWRPFRFAIHLKEQGWQPHVITIKETHQTLTEKERLLLRDVTIHEIKSPFDLTRQLGTQLSYEQKKNQPKPSGTSRTVKNFLNLFDKHFPIDTWLPLFFLRRKYVLDLVQRISPDVLWSTGDPWSSHWMAEKIFDWHKLPWVADFRDPWTLGEINLKNRSDFAYKVDKSQEESIIEKASVVTFTSKKTEKLYRNEYGYDVRSSHTIYNSYDSSLFNSKNTDKKFFKDKYLNLVFFGKFRPLSPAESFIEILEEVYRHYPKQAAKIRMHSFGKLTTQEQALAKEKGVLKNFVTHSPIALEKALPILTQADILWLSTHPSRENIIPAKLWDYLAARRPILSIAPNPEIEQILKQTQAGIQLQDRSCIANLLAKCVISTQEGKAPPIAVQFDDEAIKQYDAAVSTRKLVDIFDRLA